MIIFLPSVPASRKRHKLYPFFILYFNEVSFLPFLPLPSESYPMEYGECCHTWSKCIFFIHIIIPTAFSQLLLPITKTKADIDVFMRGEMGGHRDGKRIGKQTLQIVLNICIDSVARISFLVKFHWEPPFFSASFLPLLYTIVSHPLLLTLQKQLCRGEDKLQFNFFFIILSKFLTFHSFCEFRRCWHWT